MPVWRVSVWRDASLARFTLPRFPFLCLFLRIFPLCVVHHLFINLVNVHRGYTIVDLFISRFCSRFRLQNGHATQRDVCVVIMQCSRPEDTPVIHRSCCIYLTDDFNVAGDCM